MTRTETMKLLGLIITAYPTSKLSDDDDTINLWWEMLSDLPADTVALATKSLIATLKFPPTIADIREAVAKSSAEARGEMTAGEALALLHKTLRHPGYYDFKGEARGILGEKIWRVVMMVAPSWSELCMSEDENWPSRFLKLYAAQAAQEQYRDMVPLAVQEQLRARIGGNVVKGIEGGGT